MKIAVTASDNNGLESNIDTRFGRAPYFAIIDTETMDIKFISNSAVMSNSGAGVTAAQTIVDQKVNALISGKLGPKAFTALKAAELKLYTYNDGTIKKAVEAFKSGNLEELIKANNNSHAGLK